MYYLACPVRVFENETKLVWVPECSTAGLKPQETTVLFVHEGSGASLSGNRVKMEDTVESEMEHFRYYGKEGAFYLAWVSQCVSRDKQKRQTLKNPAGTTLRIGGLEDTVYRDRDDEVNAWGKFYLPKTVHMQVLGVVEGTSCASNQLVLMTCEDKKLYAYDGEKMHLVASSWQRLEEIKEIEYPASKSYYKGEAFQDMKSDAAEVPDSS